MNHKVLTDDEIAALPPELRRLIELPLPDLPKESEMAPPPRMVFNVTLVIIQGHAGKPESSSEQILADHFSDLYYYQIKTKGPIIGRYKFWRSVLNSAAGTEVRGALKKIIWALKILILILKTTAH
jgi:hypothetical protein